MPGVALALAAAAGTASAQAWPSKTVTIVVPFPAGGTTDVLARAVSTRLSTALGQSVIVDNRPGAGATLGAALVARATDGHTLLMGAVHHTVATSVYKSLSYNFEKDFAPITTVAMVPNVLVVGAGAPYATVKDLVAAARARPEALSYGSNGNGTAQHMIGTQFQLETGTWFGLLAPASMPRANVERLSTELVRIIHSPEFRRQMADLGAEPVGNKPEEMARQIREETAKFAGLVKAAKVTPE